eukprot:2955118-Amphidinium_carterae.1
MSAVLRWHGHVVQKSLRSTGKNVTRLGKCEELPEHLQTCASMDQGQQHVCLDPKSSDLFQKSSK